MARGSSSGDSERFAHAMELARADLVASWEKSTAFKHSGTKGELREDAVIHFLKSRLPAAFGLAKGEVVDFQGSRSTQLDVIVYDKLGCSPLVSDGDHILLPAEGVLAVVEVKSVLTRGAWIQALKAGSRLRTLRPNKASFVGPRRGGVAADNNCRLQYSIFSAVSDLSPNDWLEHEWSRVIEATQSEQLDLDCIDRVVVLDRGLISPVERKGRECASQDEVLLEWYLHLHNFLVREIARRPPLDMQLYAARVRVGWRRLS